jgi:hypothetical protein
MLLVMPADAAAALQGTTHHHAWLRGKETVLWGVCRVTRSKEEMSKRGVIAAGTETKREGVVKWTRGAIVWRMEEKEKGEGSDERPNEYFNSVAGLRFGFCSIKRVGCVVWYKVFCAVFRQGNNIPI